MAMAYAKLSSEFMSVEYLSERYAGHNLFHTSETLTTIAIVGDEIGNWQTKLNSIVEEVTDTGVTAGIFLSGFIGLVFKKYLGVTTKVLKNAEISIKDEPPIDELRLPFFSLPPRARGT